MAKTVLGKGLKSLLKSAPLARENAPEAAPRTQEVEAKIVSPGVGALLRGGSNGQSATEMKEDSGWLVAWPWIRTLLWGSDLLLVSLSTALLGLGSKRPGSGMLALATLGFFSGAGLGILAVIGEAYTSAWRKRKVLLFNSSENTPATGPAHD